MINDYSQNGLIIVYVPWDTLFLISTLKTDLYAVIYIQ